MIHVQLIPTLKNNSEKLNSSICSIRLTSYPIPASLHYNKKNHPYTLILSLTSIIPQFSGFTNILLVPSIFLRSFSPHFLRDLALSCSSPATIWEQLDSSHWPKNILKFLSQTPSSVKAFFSAHGEKYSQYPGLFHSVTCDLYFISII